MLTLLSALAALLVRLLAGVFVSGWRPQLSQRAPLPGEYSLKLGPLYLRETSHMLRGEESNS